MKAQTVGIQDRSAIGPLRHVAGTQLQALQRRLTAVTIYRRYLSPRVPPVGEQEQICRRAAEGQTAEPALLLEDRFHSTMIDMVLSIHYSVRNVAGARRGLASGETTLYSRRSGR